MMGTLGGGWVEEMGGWEGGGRGPVSLWTT